MWLGNVKESISKIFNMVQEHDFVCEVSILFDLEFEFRDLILMKKIPHTSSISVLLNMKFGGFSIGYSIGRKYPPIRVSVLGIRPKPK